MRKKASTPKELMISRYEAFVANDWKYLAKTSLHQNVEELSSMEPIEWVSLEVINSYNDTVEFKAFYKENESIKVLHEKSNFVKVNEEWKYQDGKLFNSSVERNHRCPCGSGKKFKKCCA
ncbi:YchJ family protein [Sulfurimonas sp.]|uniref:YchJ family protein n=1 Tax=Sulfurimonas sp. TaxID=2022749 RepID=UPI002AB012B6|nr:YchJ family metal-binding protein [Sulfurimonas sp.]